MTTVIDEARMQSLADSLEDGLWDVIESFLEDAPCQITEMDAARRRADWDELQRRAHSLKSSSGIFGAKALVDQCRALESEALAGSLALEGMIKAVSCAFEEVRPVLKTYLPVS